jgi:hypothetical protein
MGSGKQQGHYNKPSTWLKAAKYPTIAIPQFEQ